MMTIQRYVMCTAVFGALALGGGCRQQPAEEPTVVRPVKILTVGEAAAGIAREFPGTIQAKHHADISFEVAGRMVERLVDEGQEVKKGNVLARLDDQDLQASLDQVKASLRKAQADLNRSLRIQEEDPGAISEGKIDTDRKAMEVMQAEVRKAEKAVADAVLRAPFDGTVARRLVENFQNVKAKQPVLVFQDATQLEIEVSIPVRDIARVPSDRTSSKEMTERLKPEVQVSSLPDRSFPARVSEFATRADPSTRTFQVRLVFEPPEDVAILPGMTARVTVTFPGDESIRLPSHAVFADEAAVSQVWKLNPTGMTVHRTPVKIGALSGGDLDILEGLSVGDQVVVSGGSQLREGTKVRRFQK
jgi:RND family efflux transporter MFP subunit